MSLEDLMMGRLTGRLYYLEMMKHPRAIQPDGVIRFHLIPTYRCNLACPECHEPKGFDYTYSELKSVVDEIFSECLQPIILEFFGGEPLLCFDLVKDIYNYIEQTYTSRVQYYKIFTNTTIISDEMLDFFQREAARWCLRFSLNDDGKISNGHMLTHGYSIDGMVRVITKFLATGVSCEVHCGAYPENVDRIAQIVGFLYSIGLRAIRVGVLHYPSTFDARYAETLKQEMLKVGDFVRSHPDLTVYNFTEGWDFGRRGPFLFQKINGEYVDDLESLKPHKQMINLYREIFHAFHNGTVSIEG